MSPKINYAQNLKVTKTEILTRTEMSPKLKCNHTKMSSKQKYRKTKMS